MNKLSTITHTKYILDKYQFHFQKKFGQNFLIDQNILDKIVEAAKLTKEDFVIEVGPGMGTLTRELAAHAKEVVAVEIDKALLPILEETLGDLDNVHIISKDILKLDIKEVIEKYGQGRPCKVVANLPYYITTPVIMRFLEGEYNIASLTVMVQSEVAARMSARPSSKDYGALSLGVQYYGKSHIVTKVSRECFIPKPNVDSSVVHIQCSKEGILEVADEKWLFEIIRSAFNQRRKTMVNALSHGSDVRLDKEEIVKVLEELGLDTRIRGEALDLNTFIQFSNLTYTRRK